jgi:hypothetical protein
MKKQEGKGESGRGSIIRLGGLVLSSRVPLLHARAAHFAGVTTAVSSTLSFFAPA